MSDYNILKLSAKSKVSCFVVMQVQVRVFWFELPFYIQKHTLDEKTLLIYHQKFYNQKKPWKGIVHGINFFYKKTIPKTTTLKTDTKTSHDSYKILIH